MCGGERYIPGMGGGLPPIICGGGKPGGGGGPVGGGREGIPCVTAPERCSSERTTGVWMQRRRQGETLETKPLQGTSPSGENQNNEEQTCPLAGPKLAFRED